jgi:methionyl aminopeptidase
MQQTQGYLMTADTEKDLTALKKIGEIVALAREAMLAAIQPGMTTAELDAIGENVLIKHGAKSAPKFRYHFPGITCISINDVAAHGIPGPRQIKEGDIINVDVSASLSGYYGDTGATIAVPKAPDLQYKLCLCSREALNAAIATVRKGARLNQIGRAIQNRASSSGFNVIKNLTGHGVGHTLHEEPFNILSFFRPDDKSRMHEGMVIAIEAFVSTGAEFVREEKDGWTLRTPDRSLVAQYEHTVVVTRDRPIILTAL